MLIVCSKEGQLCNRLFHFSHIASYAKENNQILFYPYIKEYSNYFKILQTNELKKHNIFIYANPYFRWMLKIIRWLLIRIPNNKFLIYNDSENEINLNTFNNNSRRLVFLSGWLFRDNISFIKNTAYIKNIFKFNDNIIKNLDDKIKKIRKSNILLVGIHIRRGDYANFQGGKYFYEAKIYKDKMQQVRNLYDNDINVHFFITTNDSDFVNSNMLCGPDITHNYGGEASDLYCLSQCDLIVGPPSTFSAWASFYGSVPLLHITHADQIIQKSDFNIIIV
jgi:hypothetical protein